MDEKKVKAVTHSDLVQAVRAMANAAATIDAAGLGGAQQLWFMVRGLCHEYGLDLAGIQTRARQVGTDRAMRLRQECGQEG